VTYQTRTYELARSVISGKSVDWWVYEDTQPFCVGSFNDKEIGAIRLFIDAPAAAMVLEELIACGARTIFEVGFKHVKGSPKDHLVHHLSPLSHPTILISLTIMLTGLGSQIFSFPFSSRYTIFGAR